MSKFRRQIFYLSGFDPRGARFYHSLYKGELEKFATLNGMDAPHISARNTAPLRTDWRAETRDCATDYAFLHWDDLIRARWRRPRAALMRDIARTYWSYIVDYDYARAKALETTPFITFYTPFLLAALALLLTLACTLAFGWWALIAVPLCCALPFFIFKHWRPLWLVHTFAFNKDVASGADPAFTARANEQARLIADVIEQDGHDEYLIVGHSNGVSLMLVVLEQLAALHGGALPAKVKILSLGQLTQLVSLHRHSGAFKELLRRLGSTAAPWLDVSAKGDPACIPLVGPFAGALECNPPHMTIASARLHTLYPPERYTSLRRDKFNFHFLYLKCSDILGAFNYPGLTVHAAPFEDTIAAIRARQYA